jgi:hypothetical protein
MPDASAGETMQFFTFFEESAVASSWDGVASVATGDVDIDSDALEVLDRSFVLAPIIRELSG